jgi:hypothetical protein
MDVRIPALAALALALVAVAPLAQPAAAATKSSPTASAAAPAQPALAALVQARGAELAAAGIESIVARTGKQRRDLQVRSRYGPIYFGWPKGVKPVTFELTVGQGGTVTVKAQGGDATGLDDYRAAFDAVIPQAIRLARDAKARAERPRS